jgi:thiol:disulfide interchange protein
MARTELFQRSSQRALPVWLPLAVLALIVARVISSRYAVKSATDLVRWVPASQAARAAAMTRKPIFYEFSAEWCGPCHRLEDEVFRDSKLAALINEKFIPVKVVDRKRETGTNPPEVAQLEAQYRVGAFPTVVVAHHRSNPPATLVGYQGASQFESFIRGIP